MAKFPIMQNREFYRAIREYRWPEQGLAPQMQAFTRRGACEGRSFGGDLRDCPTLKWDLESAKRDWLLGLRDSPSSKWDLWSAIRDWLLGLWDSGGGKRDDLRPWRDDLRPLWDCGQVAWDVYWPLWVWRSGRT